MIPKVFFSSATICGQNHYEFILTRDKVVEIS